jgi:peptide/nickel transport system permease protein
LAVVGRGDSTAASGWRKIWRGETAFAWNAVLLTLGLMLLVVVPLFWLSGQYHVFGTDKVGQDVLYQILKSVRTGLIIGLVTTLVMLPWPCCSASSPAISAAGSMT